MDTPERKEALKGFSSNNGSGYGGGGEIEKRYNISRPRHSCYGDRVLQG